MFSGINLQNLNSVVGYLLNFSKVLSSVHKHEFVVGRYISATKLMCLMPASHRPGQVNVYVEPDLALLPELNSAGELFRRHKIVKFYYW